jgi:hypothetical protein
MSMIDFFYKIFDDMDNMFLEYSLPHKLKSKRHGIIFCHMDMDEK